MTYIHHSKKCTVFSVNNLLIIYCKALLPRLSYGQVALNGVMAIFYDSEETTGPDDDDDDDDDDIDDDDDEKDYSHFRRFAWTDM